MMRSLGARFSVMMNSIFYAGILLAHTEEPLFATNLADTANETSPRTDISLVAVVNIGVTNGASAPFQNARAFSLWRGTDVAATSPLASS